MEFKKYIHVCFINYAKAFDCVDPKKKKKKNYNRDRNTRSSYLSPKIPYAGQ